MKNIVHLMLLAVFCIAVASCKSKKDVISTAAFGRYQIECLGTGMDGTQTLKVWASGRNRANAIMLAKKTAVYEITFRGINSGNGGCNVYPVVDEPNARTKYEDYFDAFFKDGGAYEKYVTMQNQKKDAIEKLQGDGFETYGIVLVVDRSALCKRFESDNIIVK